MQQIIYSELGWVHVIVSVLSLLFGTAVLLLSKGTVWHKRIGYAYAVAMLLVNFTAFGIYRLFGSFGLFHVAAIVSLLTLLAGMVPVFTRKPHNWLNLHYSFMYWSVMGLYAAFVAETLTRIPSTPFFTMVGVATFAVMLTANLLFRRYQKRWSRQFRALSSKQTAIPVSANPDHL